MKYIIETPNTNITDKNLQRIIVSEEKFEFFKAIHYEVYRKEETLKKKWYKQDKSIEWLVEKLNEERLEVDGEISEINEINTLYNINKVILKLINEELLHEAILCMKLRSKLHQTLNKEVNHV